MKIYYFKRYRRTELGHTTGAVMDEMKFTADSAAEAQIIVRRKFGSGIAAMDWKKDFARLEDEHGNVIAEWLNGFAHA
jgi:hypothetical protein